MWSFGWYTGSQIGSRLLAVGDIDPTFDIHKANRIRVVAIGKHFDLYINDQKVGEVDDPNAVQNPENDVGVAIETCSKPVSALFTNLIVKTPGV